MATASSEPGKSSLTNTDKRLAEKALKKLERLFELCTDPRLGLKNSPPFLPDLVSETTAMLLQVWEPYHNLKVTATGQTPKGDEARYLRIHVRNLLDKTDKALLLFKEGKEKIFEETSSCRRNLTKLSLLFSHMLWEIKALFPGGSFHGDTYCVNKSEAQEFWRQSFRHKCIVQWKSFKEKLQSVHAFEEGMETMALKSTIDLTCNDHISVFEFDIFTRLFQPWRLLLRNWNYLAVTHPGYMAFLTYDQVVRRLEHYLHKPGSYIFRLSCTRMGQWAIGHVSVEGDIIQTIPLNTPLYVALNQGFQEGCYLYPDGRDVNPDLSSLCESSQKCKVKVTEEQYELYCEIGSTFQLCKICAEQDKDTQIWPCGHLLCHTCLLGWQQTSAGHTCPYCRCDIKGTESIVVEPYAPNSLSCLEVEPGEEVEDEDHEDIEVMVKEMAALKCSSLEYQAPSSRPAPVSPPPSLPAKGSRSPQGHTDSKNHTEHSTSSSTQSSNETSTIQNKTKRPQSGDLSTHKEKRSAGLKLQKQRTLSNSAENLTANPTSSTKTECSAAWLGPSSPVKQRRRHVEKELRRAACKKDKSSLGDVTRTMSS